MPGRVSQFGMQEGPEPHTGGTMNDMTACQNKTRIIGVTSRPNGSTNGKYHAADRDLGEEDGNRSQDDPEQPPHASGRDLIRRIHLARRWAHSWVSLCPLSTSPLHRGTRLFALGSTFLTSRSCEESHLSKPHRVCVSRLPMGTGHPASL